MSKSSVTEQRFIPLSVPHIRGNAWAYVKECLDTEWVSSAGKYVEKLEAMFADYVGAKYAVACVNGTAALQVALRLAGVKSGDEVLIPTLTFIASVNAVHYAGARPVFFDSDDYYNLDCPKLQDFLANKTELRNGQLINRESKRRIAALMPVHVFGNAADMESIMAIAAEYNLPVVEDAAESLGTYYTKGSLAGKHTGTTGQSGCFSFNGNKIITTGGGGMIVTDDAEIASKARYLTTQAKDDELRYVHHDIGYNFRLTNLQAALGVAQMEDLPDFLHRKRQNFRRYQELLSGVAGLGIADIPPYAENNCWMIALQVDRETYPLKTTDAVIEYLAQNRIQARPIWTLNHRQRPYENCAAFQIEKATALHRSTINLPCSVNLTDSDIQRITQVLTNV